MDEGVRGCMGKGGCVLIMAGLRWKLETHRKFCMGMCLRKEWLGPQEDGLEGRGFVDGG